MSATLAVIDMQNVFGATGSPWRTPRFDEVVAPVRALASAFGPHAVFTRFLAPARPAGAWVDYYAAWPFALQPPDAEAWQVVPELADVAAASGGADGHGATVDATTFGKWGPALAAVTGDGPLVVAGVSTDCCVLSTVLAAADAGVPVLVAADACAGVDDASHHKALDVMALYGPLVTVTSTSRALALAAATR